MNLNDYPIYAMTYRLPTADTTYAIFNLPSEVGEFFGHCAKYVRDGGDELTNRELLLKELGDILWTVTAICEDLDSSLDEVAQMNIDKLESRKQRNVLQGSGDNR